MGRPKTINAMVAEIAVEAVRRVKEKMADEPTYRLTESDAKVIKTLAEAQVVLQKRRPGEDDGEDEDSGPTMSIEELERHTVGEPEKPREAADDA
jgi:hypothetical protein